MGEPAFEMEPNFFDDVHTFFCETATSTWNFIEYVYNYIDETDFKFQMFSENNVLDKMSQYIILLWKNTHICFKHS